MTRKILFAILLSSIVGLSFGQTIDSLKLNDSEIPAGYSKSNEILCVTPHANSFYEQTDLYATFLGRI